MIILSLKWRLNVHFLSLRLLFTKTIFIIAVKHSNVLYVELAHGGHLGFYEGGLIYPDPITWLDRTVVSLVGSLTLVHADRMKGS